MKYKILYSDSDLIASSAKDLEKDVNNHILTGWKPQGGVNLFVKTFEYGPPHYLLQQAMVKEK